jgi:hypothetical protein
MRLLTTTYTEQISKLPKIGRYIVAQFDAEGVIVYQVYYPPSVYLCVPSVPLRAKYTPPPEQKIFNNCAIYPMTDRSREMLKLMIIDRVRQPIADFLRLR